MAGRPADRPNVFRSPTGILASLIYQASLRIPQPNLPGASGRATDMAIRVSTAAAGRLVMTRDANGNYVYTTELNSLPVER